MEAGEPSHHTEGFCPAGPGWAQAAGQWDPGGAWLGRWRCLGWTGEARGGLCVFVGNRARNSRRAEGKAFFLCALVIKTVFA